MKRADIKRHPLADTTLAGLEPESKEYRELNGNGLYFRVKPDGGKSWQLRYKRPAGNWTWMGLGGYPEVSGALARDKATELRKVVSSGVDPLEQKRSAKAAIDAAKTRTFRAAADAWLKAKEEKGLAPSTLNKIRTYLDKDILPALGDKPLDEITRTDCADLQASIEARDAHNVAEKCRTWINQIFGRAIGLGLTENDPGSRLRDIAAQAPKTQQHPHLLEPEIGDFLTALKNTPSRLTARTAAWLCIWTASRPGMVRLAEWKEFDLDKAIWTTPAAKMKMRRDFVCPLPKQAISALKELQCLTGRSRWLFPGVGAKNPTISENTINKVFATDGYKGRLVGHGTRHTASTLLREHGWPKEHVEAQLAHKEEGISGVADLTPLKGRDVLLWPDNDVSGKACMEAVADKLREIGAASVRVIALDVFKRKPMLKKERAAFAKGGQWDGGDDAADALAKGWTAVHFAELESSGELFGLAVEKSVTQQAETKPEPKTKTAAKRPAKSKNDLMPGGFRLTPEGVFYAGDDGEARPVCSPLEILARTRDDKGHNWGLLVEFEDPDGTKKRWNIPARTMTGDFGKDVLGPLVDMGLRLAGSRSGRNARNDLQSYLGGFDSAQRARLVTRLGWHDSAFLLPEQQVGTHSEHLHFYEAGAQLPPISEAGTLEQWQQQIGALCVGNHRLAFVVGVAFAGPLLHMLGHESGGFHLYGDSSGGKTTHLQVAASIYGGPRLVRSWRSTDNALESIAAAHSDGLLVLDEIGMCDPRIIGETVYMLGNGTGKARANDRGQAGRQVQEWRLLFLSTGEKTLAQHTAEANKELKAGMEVRMLAVPADASKGLGMFDALNGFEDAAALSDALKARVANYYGTPLIAFLSALCEPGKRHGWSAILRRTLEGFIAKSLPASASGQAHRAAARFGLAAAAGELATAMGITGWPDGTATTAARVCLNAWLNERGGARNFEGDAILARLRQVIERFGESRFTRWESTAAKIDEHGPRTIDRLGFRKTLEHGLGDALHTTNTYYVLPEAWRSEVFKGMNISAVNKELLQRGVLEPGSDGKASSLVRLPGLGPQRCYIVKTIPGTDESEARAA